MYLFLVLDYNNMCTLYIALYHPSISKTLFNAYYYPRISQAPYEAHGTNVTAG